jgi:hypothetical protein
MAGSKCSSPGKSSEQCMCYVINLELPKMTFSTGARASTSASHRPLPTSVCSPLGSNLCYLAWDSSLSHEALELQFPDESSVSIRKDEGHTSSVKGLPRPQCRRTQEVHEHWYGPCVPCVP